MRLAAVLMGTRRRAGRMRRGRTTRVRSAQRRLLYGAVTGKHWRRADAKRERNTNEEQAAGHPTTCPGLPSAARYYESENVS